MSNLFIQKEYPENTPEKVDYYTTDADRRYWNGKGWKYSNMKESADIYVTWFMEPVSLPADVRQDATKALIKKIYLGVDSLRNPVYLEEDDCAKAVGILIDAGYISCIDKEPREDDIERYPLPICMEPAEEQAALNRRRQKIKATHAEWQERRDIKKDWIMRMTSAILEHYAMSKKHRAEYSERIADVILCVPRHDIDIKVPLPDVSEKMKEALMAVRRHGLIEKDGYETVVGMVNDALQYKLKK
jgi:hypothetical protein